MKKTKLISIIVLLFSLINACSFSVKEDDIKVFDTASKSEDNELENADIYSSDTDVIYGKRKIITSDDSAKEILKKEEFQKLVASMSKASLESNTFQAPAISDGTAHSFMNAKYGIYVYQNYMSFSEDGKLFEHKDTSGSLEISDSLIYAEHSLIENANTKEIQVQTKIEDIVWIENDFVFLMADSHKKYDENGEIFDLYILHFLNDAVEVYGLKGQPIGNDYYLGDTSFGACELLFTATINRDSIDSNTTDSDIPIQAARDFFSKIEGQYTEELFGDAYYSVEISKVPDEDDYLIGTEGISVFYTNQCIEATTENGQNVFYFYNQMDNVAPGYCQYCKAVVDGDYLLIYYGDSKDNCNELGSKCNLRESY